MLELVNRRRGLFVKLPSVDVIDLCRACGFDFAVVDLEHSQLSEGEARVLVRHAKATGFPALVRVPAVDRGLVNRLLEAGAAGIQLSTVVSTGQVHELRHAMHYAPEGARSISLTHPAAKFGAVPLRDYLAAARSAAPLLVAQIETGQTHDPLEEILSAGVDVAFLGMTDLSVDLRLEEVRVRSRVEEIAAAAGRAGIPLGAFGLDDPRVRYELVSSDLALLRAAMADAA
jgi:2-keto-3-deoxy-L-rhamnonate aldolase RhmA